MKIYQVKFDHLQSLITSTNIFFCSIGPNAISVSLSPLNNYLLVGLAARRGHHGISIKQMVAQVYKLRAKDTDDDDEDSMEVCDSVCHMFVSSVTWYLLLWRFIHMKFIHILPGHPFSGYC